jgi:hypothetical protein
MHNNRCSMVVTLLVIWASSGPNVGVLCFAAVGTSQTRHGSFKGPQTRTSSPIMTLQRNGARNQQGQGRIPLKVSTSVDDDNDDTGLDVSEEISTLRGGAAEEKDVTFWPSMDELDRRLIKIALPCIANFAINPLIGAVDLFWVNRMGNALAVAGQSAANQVFNSAFWLASFLPSVTATLVSKENAKGDQEGVQDAVCQALAVGILIAIIGTPLLFFHPENVLSSVLKGVCSRAAQE